jgi:hypothetical protein
MAMVIVKMTTMLLAKVIVALAITTTHDDVVVDANVMVDGNGDDGNDVY